MASTITRGTTYVGPDGQRRGAIKCSTPAAETSPAISLGNVDAVVALTPGSGGSMLAQATWSLQSDVEAGTAVWHDWDQGTVTTKTNAMLLRATAVRCVSTTATGVMEIGQ